jgi:glycosyltransferase involved in cell wall biosynthesis
MKNSVAFYIDTKPLKRDWSLTTGDNSLSGTDTMIISTALALSERGRTVTLYATSHPQAPRPPKNNLAIEIVSSLAEAYARSSAAQTGKLVFATKSTDEELKLITGERARTNLIGWAHNSPSKPWLRLVGNCANLEILIAVSNHQAKTWMHRKIYDRTIVIPNFIESCHAEEGRPTQDREKTILYIGALRPSKGFHHLSAVWPEIHALHPEWSLAVAGSSGLYTGETKLGPAGLSEPAYENEILHPLGGTIERAQSLNVTFLGSIPKNNLHERIQKCAIAVVNPNTSGSVETFCMSAVESNLLYTPVIAGAAGALPETVGHDVGGLLSKDDQQLKDNIVRLIKDASKRASLGETGARTAESRYRRSTAIDRWESVLDNHKIPKFPYKTKHQARSRYFIQTICRKLELEAILDKIKK